MRYWRLENTVRFTWKFESSNLDTQRIFYGFSNLTDLNKLHSSFQKKYMKHARSEGLGQIWAGPAQSGTNARGGGGGQISNPWQVGPGGQRHGGAESVSGVAARPIRTEIDGGEPLSPSRWGMGETLALATGKARRGSPRGVEGSWGCCRAAAVSLKTPSRPKLAGSGARSGVWPCSSTMVLGFYRRWWRPRAAKEKTGCKVRFRSSRGTERCRGRAEGDGRRRPKPSPSTPAPAMFLELSSPGNGWGSSVGVLWVERRGAGGRMASRGRFWPVQWV
jgi:hypothetical protein